MEQMAKKENIMFMIEDLKLLDAYIPVAKSTESIVKMTVERTDKEGNVVKSETNSRFAHGAQGLVTEVGEIESAFSHATGSLDLTISKQVDMVNLIEECGDVIWYLAITVDSLGLTFTDLRDDIGLTFTDLRDDIEFSPKKAKSFMVSSASEILDKNKRAVFYGKPLEVDKVRKELCTLIYSLFEFCNWATIVADGNDDGSYSGIEIAIDKVTRKLTGDKGRYKDGFSQDEAYNRDLDQEREVLES
jgi:NTP pyrophosphatase (non-canonical NTP hydrolase)